MPCPFGAICNREFKLGGDTVFTGVQWPVSKPGYWASRAPQSQVVPGELYCFWMPTPERCVPGTWLDPNGFCVPLDPRKIDSTRMYQCIEDMVMYYCPFDSLACPGGYTDSCGPDVDGPLCGDAVDDSCAEGYTGPKCAYCADGFYEVSGACTGCIGSKNSNEIDEDEKKKAENTTTMVYSFSIGTMGGLFFFGLYCYLRDDMGVGLVRVACPFLFKKVSAKQKEAAAKAAANAEVKEHVQFSSEARAEAAFRPTKIIITMIYLQIHSGFKNNYDIVWPPKLQRVSSALFAGLNFSLMASTSCLFHMWLLPAACCLHALSLALCVLSACHVIGPCLMPGVAPRSCALWRPPTWTSCRCLVRSA